MPLSGMVDGMVLTNHEVLKSANILPQNEVPAIGSLKEHVKQCLQA